VFQRQVFSYSGFKNSHRIYPVLLELLFARPYLMPAIYPSPPGFESKIADKGSGVSWLKMDIAITPLFWYIPGQIFLIMPLPVWLGRMKFEKTGIGYLPVGLSPFLEVTNIIPYSYLKTELWCHVESPATNLKSPGLDRVS